MQHFKTFSVAAALMLLTCLHFIPVLTVNAQDNSVGVTIDGGLQIMFVLFAVITIVTWILAMCSLRDHQWYSTILCAVSMVCWFALTYILLIFDGENNIASGFAYLSLLFGFVMLVLTFFEAFIAFKKAATERPAKTESVL